MKKVLTVLLIALLSFGLLAGCGGEQGQADAGQNQNAGEPAGDDGETGAAAADENLQVIKVGASITPHAEILAQVKDDLKAQGYDLQVVEFTDYVMPNLSLDEGELDANFFQHQPYLDGFNEERGTKLVSIGTVHYEPFGIYAGKTSDLSAIPEGGSIAIPNDGTNEARALLLLEAQGLIKLKEGITFTATVLDIAENPKNLSIKEIEAAQLARSLQDVDAAVINGNYAIQAGLKVKDALAIEDKDSIAADTYANVLVVKEGHENDEATKALLAALQSDTAKKFMEEKYEGAVIAAF